MYSQQLFRASHLAFSRDQYIHKKHQLHNPTNIQNKTVSSPSTGVAANINDTTPPSSFTRPQKRRIVYADTPTNISPLASKPVVYDSPDTAAKAHIEHERNATKLFEAPKKPQIDAEDWLATFKRIRTHPIYRITRLMVVGSSLYLLSRRVVKADPLPEEQFDENANFTEKATKSLYKTQRIVFNTLERVWSPWEHTDTAKDQLSDINPESVVQSPVKTHENMDITIEPMAKFDNILAEITHLNSVNNENTKCSDMAKEQNQQVV